MPRDIDRDQLIELLREIIRNDKTQYEHHQLRPFDMRPPSAVGSTRWREPREMAVDALRFLGVAPPSAADEFIDRAEKRADDRVVVPGCSAVDPTSGATCRLESAHDGNHDPKPDPAAAEEIDRQQKADMLADAIGTSREEP